MLNLAHVAPLLGETLGGAERTLAYIGPGAGLGALAVAIAVVVGVLLLAAGLVWYPLKRLLKGRPEEAVGGSRTDESR